jgi:multidrug resistance efflux pump
MFRTSYDSRGKPHVAFDGEFAGTQAALRNAHASIRAANEKIRSLNAALERQREVNQWRIEALSEVANDAQDEYARAEGLKAGLAFLSSNKTASIKDIEAVVAAAQQNAKRDKRLLLAAVEHQNRLRPRSLG